MEFILSVNTRRRADGRNVCVYVSCLYVCVRVRVCAAAGVQGWDEVAHFNCIFASALQSR